MKHLVFVVLFGFTFIFASGFSGCESSTDAGPGVDPESDRSLLISNPIRVRIPVTKDSLVVDKQQDGRELVYLIAGKGLRSSEGNASWVAFANKVREICGIGNAYYLNFASVKLSLDSNHDAVKGFSFVDGPLYFFFNENQIATNQTLSSETWYPLVSKFLVPVGAADAKSKVEAIIANALSLDRNEEYLYTHIKTNFKPGQDVAFDLVFDLQVRTFCGSEDEIRY